MTREEFATRWMEYVESHDVTEETINDFCNINASSYEEYMALWEILVELIGE